MRRSLKFFIKEAWDTIEPNRFYNDNWHIDAISDHLQAVVNGDIKRLIINIPPRHMKSISVSVALPAWTWTFDPSRKFLFSSYQRNQGGDQSTMFRPLEV